MSNFDPNKIGVPNGNYFALPYSTEESDIVIVSIPWDVTTSYRPGTAQGPNAIMDASLQIDLFDPNIKEGWLHKIATHPIEEKIESDSGKYREVAERVIEHLEGGGEESGVSHLLLEVNSASKKLNTLVEERAAHYIEKGKIPIVLGGDHSVPLGNLKAIAKRYPTFGILHLDAHADLRDSYEGFRYSHASIMYNALNEIPNIERLTQVAIRDFCQEEADFIDRESKIVTFTDSQIREELFSGGNWREICDKIVESLPNFVYISFDIDALSPELCPNTGTPVPGGLSYNMADYLLLKLANSNKEIVGADLCEVAPGKQNWGELDANVGARLLYKLSIYISYNKSRIRKSR